MKYAVVLSILSSLCGPGRSFLPTNPNGFHSAKIANQHRTDVTSRCSSRIPHQDRGEKEDEPTQLPGGNRPGNKEIGDGSPKQSRRRRQTDNPQQQRYPAGSNGRGRGNNNARRRTTVANSPRKKVFDSILGKFRDSEEIDMWMNHTVMKQLEEQPQSGDHHILPPFPNKSWSSRDDTEFIRCLRDRGAYYALELYACHFAQKNLFVYTAAISSMASCPDKRKRKRVLTILGEMDKANILPSSVTFASLFQAANGPEETRNIMTRLQKYKGKTTWSVEAFNQAIIACSRKPPRQKHATNKSWQVALEFSHKLRREGLSPNLKTYTALLHVCAQTGQLRIAMSLVKEIESTPGISANARVFGVVMNVCAQAGDYIQANAVLKTMQKEGHDINLAHCSALLKALSKNGNVPVSLAVLDMMIGSEEEDSELPGDIVRLQLVRLPPIAPDLVALNTILASCAKANDFEAARALLNRMRDGDFRLTGASQPIYPDVISYSLLLSSCRDPATARAIWKEMHLSRRYRVGVVRPNQIIYARLIAVCAKADVPDMESARFFLSSAHKDGVKPTVFMYTAAIWTAERSGNYTFAKEILDEMKAEEGVEANGVSYAGVMSAAAKAGLVDEAFELYKESKKVGCSPTAATYNALAMAVRHSQIPDKLVKLETIFIAMDDDDRRVDVGGALIEQLIVEHGRVGSYAEAKRVFDMIEGPSNGPCLRAMLNACATADTGPRWKEAVAMLHSSDITANAIGPGEIDQGALSNAVIACAKADCWEESLNLLQLYGVRKTRSSSVSVVALNAVIAACGRKGRPDIAVGLLNDMKRRFGVAPDERSYRSAVIACNQAEHQKRRYETQPLSPSRKRADRTTRNDPAFEWWECALALLRQMKEDGLKPDIQTLSSAISACEAAGQWQRALSVLQSIIDENTDEEERFLNLFCFNAVISSCEKGGAWVEAVEIYERMISYGGPLRPNFVTLSSLVLALAKAGQKELALSKYTDGVKKKIVNPWRTTKDNRGRPLKAMDLHMFNSAMASSAVRSFMDSLASRSNVPKVEDDLVIIVGKGLRSSESAKLLPLVLELLSQEYGISAKLDQDNSGRLVVDADCLRTFVAGRNWS